MVLNPIKILLDFWHHVNRQMVVFGLRMVVLMVICLLYIFSESGSFRAVKQITLLAFI